MAISSVMRRGIPTDQSSVEGKDVCQRSTEEGYYALRLPVRAFCIFLGKSRQSLWFSLLLPLSAAVVETHGTAAELDWLSVVWSAMMLMISGFALFMFGVLLIYCIDLLTEVLIFRTGPGYTTCYVLWSVRGSALMSLLLESQCMLPYLSV